MISSQKNERITWKIVLILALGLLLTSIISIYIYRQTEFETKQEFNLVCNDIKAKIPSRLHAHAQLLRSCAAFFTSSKTIDRKEWKTFIEASKIEKNMPGIQGVGFSLIIPKNNLKQHIKYIRKQGFKDYTVKPAGERSFYTSIIYLEPFTGRNLRAFGYDMYSEPTRRKAMELSRDYDMATLTGKVTLVQENKENVQAGTLMYVPVYQNGMPFNTVEQRRSAIIGWVYSPYRMNDLMNGILGSRELTQSGKINLQIFDDSISAATLLYESKNKISTASTGKFLQNLSLPVEFNGKKWILSFTSNDKNYLVVYGKAILVLVGGILINILLFLLYKSLINTRQKAQILAQKLTVDLKDTESKLGAIFDNSFDAIAVHVNGVWDSCNSAALRLFQVDTKEEVIGKSILTVIDPAEHERIRAFVVNRMDGKPAPSLYTTRGIKKDGTIFEMEVSLSTFIHNDIKHFLVILRDISFQKKAKDILAASALRYQTLLKTASDGIHIIDYKGQIMEVSDTFCNMLGYTREELLQINISELDVLKEKDELKNTIAELIKHPAVFETKHRCKDGTVIDTEINAIGVELEGINYLYAASRNITERKNTEERIRQSERKYRLLFENMNEGFAYQKILLNEEGNPINFLTIDVNSAYEKNNGLKYQDVVGKTILEILPGASTSEIEKYGKVALTSEPVKFEYYSKTFNKYFHVNAFCPQHGYFATIFEDITEKKLAEDKIVKLNSELREFAIHLQTIREEERADIAKEIHDEFSQNLVALTMNASFLKGKLQKEEHKKILDEQIEIANGLIVASRSLFNSLHPIMLEELGLEAAIKWYASTKLKLTDIKFEMQTYKKVENEQKYKEIKLAFFRIFQEVLTNIIRYAKATIVSVELTKTNEIISMKINDNGVGFDIKSVDTLQHHGIVGLRERAHAINGEFFIDSVIGTGTNVKIIVPVGLVSNE